MKLSEVPIPVLISGGIIVFSLVLFVGTFPFITSARDEALSQNGRLNNEIRSTNSSIQRAKDDQQFVIDNERRFEEAMASDEIIPHTRRAAARQMQTVAVEHGLTSLNYNFALAGQDSRRGQQGGGQETGAYRLHVEDLSLEVGAPMDRPVYAFIEDLIRSIPGTIVLRQFSLSRSENISTQQLNQVARGQNSGIITGNIAFSWRTAQATREEGQ